MTWDVSDVTDRMHGLRFEKSQLVECLPRKKTVDFRGSSWPDGFVRYGRRALVGLRGDDVKAVRSFKCFCVSGFLCYPYMSDEHSMYILHIHVVLCNSLIIFITLNIQTIVFIFIVIFITFQPICPSAEIL